ncbi:MAG: hypothetical protein WCN64_06430 [Planctomycetota bacterium]
MSRWSLNVIIMGLSCALSLLLFFQNPWLSTDLNNNSYAWFVDFSRTIFQANSAYYAESILLPLIARLIKVSNSLLAYKYLCAILTCLILPVFTWCSLKILKNRVQAIIFTLLFASTFQYLEFYILGFPDPLTILFLGIAAFSRKSIYVLMCICLAGLSHFSMALLGACGLAILFLFAPFIEKKLRIGLAIASILGVLIARIFLALWYLIFNYELISRVDFIFHKGAGFFIERYQSNIAGFWLTPGIPFLLFYAIITGFFIYRRNYYFAIAAICSLSLGYFSIFITIDGLRVFAVTIVSAYILLMISFIQVICAKFKIT